MLKDGSNAREPHRAVSGLEKGSVPGLLVTQLFPVPRGSPKGRSPSQSPHDLGAACPLPPRGPWGRFGSLKEHPFLFGKSWS